MATHSKAKGKRQKPVQKAGKAKRLVRRAKPRLGRTKKAIARRLPEARKKRDAKSKRVGHKSAAKSNRPTALEINGNSALIPMASAGDAQARIRELIKLAKEQGYLTFDDLNEALPPEITDADELDQILTRLRKLEIDIIEASEVDRYKDGKKDVEEEEEEKPETKLDILDDPVRMYLKQMGQVPLLTREQEVEISKRIEEAEQTVQRSLNQFGFIARAHLDLAAKLTEGRERFDRVILDKKIESRERYIKLLPRLCSQV